MPYYRVGGVMVHVRLGKSAKKPPPAPCCGRLAIAGIERRCMAVSAYLCDAELADGKTCDAPLCAEHATQVGPDRRLCRIHAKQAR